MISMLDKIVAKTEERLIEAKSNKSLDQLKEEVSKLDVSDEFPFKEALKCPRLSRESLKDCFGRRASEREDLFGPRSRFIRTRVTYRRR